MIALSSGYDIEAAKRRQKLSKQFYKEFLAKGKSPRNAEMAAWQKARHR